MEMHINKTKFLSNSIDYSTRRESKQDMGIMKAKMVDYDKRNDDFRFKKNLTNTADRILSNETQPSITPASYSSKYEEIKRASKDFINGGPAPTNRQEVNTLNLIFIINKSFNLILILKKSIEILCIEFIIFTFINCNGFIIY